MLALHPKSLLTSFAAVASSNKQIIVCVEKPAPKPMEQHMPTHHLYIVCNGYIHRGLCRSMLFVIKCSELRR